MSENAPLMCNYTLIFFFSAFKRGGCSHPGHPPRSVLVLSYASFVVEKAKTAKILKKLFLWIKKNTKINVFPPKKCVLSKTVRCPTCANSGHFCRQNSKKNVQKLRNSSKKRQLLVYLSFCTLKHPLSVFRHRKVEIYSNNCTSLQIRVYSDRKVLLVDKTRKLTKLTFGSAKMCLSIESG